MSGGMDVVGLVMGMHLIEDIKVAVPFKVSVHITAEQMHRSKDLWRAISQKKIFQLSGNRSFPNTGLKPSAQKGVDTARIVALEKENKTLKQKLEQERQRNGGLQDLLAGLQAQLAGFQKALGRIESLPALSQQPVMVQGAQMAPVASSAPAVAPSEAVGGEAPLFIPSEIAPKDAEANIQIADDTSTDSKVSSAASRLKQLRKQQGGG